MTKPTAGKTGCFKLGCFGCAGLVLLAILVFGTLIGVGALVGAPEPSVEESTVEQAVPPGPAVGWSTQTDSGDPVLPPGGLVPEVSEPGRVVLDLKMGEFEVVAGDGPGPIRIEGDFDTSIFELETEYERYGESGWTYTIRTKNKVGWYRMMFADRRQTSFVRIILPRGVPLSLEGEVGMGEVRMDLGGLWLVNTDLVAGMGEFTIDFDEPLLAPMDGFRLASKMGECRVRSLGNASPSTVHVRHRMGALSLGLVGAWQNDTEVRGGITMGELLVWVPDDVHVDVENMRQVLGASNVADRSMLDEVDEAAPTLRLNLSGGMGSVEVLRR
jgi:hypothetical protein